MTLAVTLASLRLVQRPPPWTVKNWKRRGFPTHLLRLARTVTFYRVYPRYVLFALLTYMAVSSLTVELSVGDAVVRCCFYHPVNMWGPLAHLNVHSSCFFGLSFNLNLSETLLLSLVLLFFNQLGVSVFLFVGCNAALCLALSTGLPFKAPQQADQPAQCDHLRLPLKRLSVSEKCKLISQKKNHCRRRTPT